MNKNKIEGKAINYMEYFQENETAVEVFKKSRTISLCMPSVFTGLIFTFLLGLSFDRKKIQLTLRTDKTKIRKPVEPNNL